MRPPGRQRLQPGKAKLTPRSAARPRAATSARSWQAWPAETWAPHPTDNALGHTGTREKHLLELTPSVLLCFVIFPLSATELPGSEPSSSRDLHAAAFLHRRVPGPRCLQIVYHIIHPFHGTMPAESYTCTETAGGGKIPIFTFKINLCSIHQFLMFR